MENIKFKFSEINIGYMPISSVHLLKIILPRIMHSMLYSVIPVNLNNHPTII
jgi:hypothetical protein